MSSTEQAAELWAIIDRANIATDLAISAVAVSAETVRSHACDDVRVADVLEDAVVRLTESVRDPLDRARTLAKAAKAAWDGVPTAPPALARDAQASREARSAAVCLRILIDRWEPKADELLQVFGGAEHTDAEALHVILDTVVRVVAILDGDEVSGGAP